MIFGVRVLQRVGIDLDDEHGDHPGEGATLVDLALLALDLELPFAPYPDLVIVRGDARVELDEVVWDDVQGRFECSAEPVWMQTRARAQGIVEALIACGFRPIPFDHRENEIH